MRRFSGPAIAITVFIGCALVVETFLALFAPLPDPYAQYKYFSLNQFIRSEFPVNYHIQTEAEEGLPGVKGQNRFSTNNMGFRGDYLAIPKPKTEFRIFMIGGSTTECLYLDDAESINAVLQQELQKNFDTARSFKVYNAGKSGDASDDHISMLVHRIVHLDPDMIIVLAGFNDLLRSIAKHDNLHFVKKTNNLEKHPFLHLLATEFQIPRRLYYAVKGISASEQEVLETITLKSNYKQKIALRKSAPASSEKPRTDTDAYSRNLKTIYGVAKAHAIQTILMTQQSTWASPVDPEARDWHWLRYRGGRDYREDVMSEALESFNDVVRQISKTYSIPLYDLEKRMPKSSEFFYDDVHFNVKGSRTAAKELAGFIFQQSLIPHQTVSGSSTNSARSRR